MLPVSAKEEALTPNLVETAQTTYNPDHAVATYEKVQWNTTVVLVTDPVGSGYTNSGGSSSPEETRLPLSVRGSIRFCEDNAPAPPNCTLRAQRRVALELWECDGVFSCSTKTFLGSTRSGEDGFYGFAPVQNDDGFLQGTLDVFVRVIWDHDIVRVTSDGTATYMGDTNVHSNVPDGPYDVNIAIVGDARGVAAIFDTIEIGYDYALSLGHTHNKVTVVWPDCDETVCYTRTRSDGYTLGYAEGRNEEWDEDVILHEYTHSIEFQVYVGFIPMSGGEHNWDECENVFVGFSEGFASFFSVAANFERGYGDGFYPRDVLFSDVLSPLGSANLETSTPPIPQVSGQIDCPEGTTAYVLWDIFDNGNDGRDTLSAGMGPIWDVYANFLIGGHHAYTIREFWDGWFDPARGHACLGCASGQQIWGTYFDHGINMDTTAPSNPNGFSSSHTLSVWSKDTTVFISWFGATDDLSGVNGYSIDWTVSSTTVPDMTVDTTTTAATSPALADGSFWWFHVRTIDSVGNWNGTAFHVGPFLIETVPPLPPTLQSPLNGLQATSSTITFTWLASTDAASGVAYYKLSLTSLGTTTTWSGIATTSFTVTNLSFGDYNWQVSAVDNAGNEGTWSESWSFSELNHAPQWPAGPSLSYTKSWSTPDNAWKVTLTWPQATDDVAVTGYNVYFANSLEAILPATQTSYVDFLPAYDGVATYDVYATDGDGGKSAPLSLTFYVGCARGRPCPTSPVPGGWVGPGSTDMEAREYRSHTFRTWMQTLEKDTLLMEIILCSTWLW